MNNNEINTTEHYSPIAGNQNFLNPLTQFTGAEITKQESDNEFRNQIQMMLANEFLNIEKLFSEGQISKEQVAKLTNDSIEKAKLLLQTKQESPIKNALENTDFFKQNGRQSVLEYLKGLDTAFDEDEVNKIAQLVEAVEQNAVKNYIDNLRRGENMQRENAEAKQRLNTIAQNASTSSPYQKIFTRADIGKMSTQEFLKNEKLIMDQLRKGQIK